MKWLKLLEKVKQDCAIEKGSNLSAMPEQRSQLYTLVFSIAEKMNSDKDAKEKKSEKQKRLEKNLLVHESGVAGIKTSVAKPVTTSGAAATPVTTLDAAAAASVKTPSSNFFKLRRGQH